MAKGNTAKNNLITKIASALSEDYIGPSEDGKKFYFWSTEDGEKVQVCISMTVPKTPIQTSNIPASTNGFDAEPKKENVSMGEDEKETLDRLMKELGL